MRKHLILMMALALVAGLACAAYAEVQNVKVGGDINAWYMMRQLDVANSELKTQSFASIMRLRVDADLTDNITATVRLLNERYWGNETENAARDSDTTPSNTANTNVDIDLAYVTLKEFLYSPLTVTVGRQNLRFGNAMIVGDPDTNNQATTASAFGGATRDPDLSARKAFDAVRATLNYDPLVVDMIYSQITDGTLTVSQDGTTLYGVNANYKLNDKTTMEGYYFGRYSGRETATYVPVDKPDRVDAVGARLVTVPMNNLTYMLEGAYQFGKRIDSTARTALKREAWAVETGAEYLFKDVKFTPTLAGGYAYFTGNKENSSKKCRAWDPMYEDQSYGDIANALFDQSNAHIVVLSGSMKPMDDVTLLASGYGFWWDKKYHSNQTITDRRGNSLVMNERKYAGSEVDLKAIYDYTEDVQLALLTGVLFPGASFGSRHTTSEVIGSMKVTF